MAGCGDDAAGAQGEQRLPLVLEVVNLEVVRRDLLTSRPPGLEVCPNLEGKTRFGWIPHRLADEPATSDTHALPFAAVYGGTRREPRVLLDLDGDRRLACEETLSMVTVGARPGAVFRTFTLAWPADGGASRQQRYRLTLPSSLPGAGAASFVLELVDAPVARWRRGDQEAIFVLYDGNFNGVIDGRFGDALLLDATGEGFLSLDPRDGNLRSLHQPFELPWGRFRVTSVDPGADSLVLERLPGADLGESTEPGVLARCSAPGSDAVQIGTDEAGDRPQLVYFWWSECSSCQADVERLRPVLEYLGDERLRALGVSFDEEREGYDSFIERNLLGSWPQCFEGRTAWDNAVALRLGSIEPSSFVLLDRSGREVARGVGFDQLYPELAALFPDLPTPGP